MGVCRFIYDNKWLIGDLDASTEDSNFPASFTRHRWFTRTWRSTTVASDQWLRLDRGGSSPSVSAAAIRFNNFSVSAAVKIQGGSDGTSWTYDQSWSAHNRVMVHFPSSAQALRWWRILISDATNVNGYSEVGCVFLGGYFQPARNFDYGLNLNWEDPSLISFSEGGQISSVFREKYFKKQYKFSHFKTAEKEEFDSVFAIVGQSRGFIFIEDSDDPYDTSHYVRMTDFKWNHTTHDNWALSMALEELR